MASWFKDKDFQRHLLTFICRDRNFLKRCGGLLHPKDFKPNRDETDERWIIADLALTFWRKHKSPISSLLRMHVTEFCHNNNVDEKRRKQLNKLVDQITSGEKLVAVEAIEDRVSEYLRKKKVRNALDELTIRHEEGTLDNETLVEICRDVLAYSGKPKRIVSKVMGKNAVDKRIARRSLGLKDKMPLLLIDDFDKRCRAIGRGNVGLLVALYKMGKSLALIQLALNYALQGLNVLFFTLEDDVEEVEDRIDASLSGIPIEKLSQLPRKLKRRFNKFRTKVANRLRVIDCTEDGISVEGIEEEWERQRDEGFDADVIIIDYDDEIIPPTKYKDNRRMEFADIYKALRRFAARRSLIIWTAAQTKRISEKTKIITGDKIAEDISKARKVTLAIGIGQGESHEDSRYLYVIAHKRSRSKFGFEIMSRFNQGIFYDRERTARIIWANRGKKKAA